jgi:hypothetical protein
MKNYIEFFTGGIADVDVRTIIAQGPKPEYVTDNDWADQYYLPARFLSACNQNTLITLPKHESLQEFVEWFQENIFRPRFNQTLNVLWLDDTEYLLDRNIDNRALCAMRDFVSNANRSVAFPYSTYPEFFEWFNQLDDFSLLGENQGFYSEFANKTILHPGSSSGLDLSLIPGLRIPYGVNCFNFEELLEQSANFRGENHLIKDPYGSGGSGISLVKTFADLHVEHYPQMLEECLDLQTLEDGSELSLSVQFTGAKVMDVPTRQIVHGTHSAGNVIHENRFEHLYEDVMQQAHIVSRVLSNHGMRGLGGVDFLFENNKAWLVDVNLGRPTAAHPAWFTRESYYGLDSQISFATLDMPFNNSIVDVWGKVSSLLSENVNFMPLYHLQNMESRWICFAETGNVALNTLQNIREIIA